MMTKVLRVMNSQGRLQIPKNLREYVGLHKESQAVLCKSSAKDEELRILPMDKLKDSDEIIAIIQIDNKGRFVQPKHLRDGCLEKETIFEMFVRNGELILQDSGL